MAQLDFCFYFYDNDCARDVAHMNRLERGAYLDIISAQRKFGRLERSLIDKILGNDSVTVWYALSLVLKCEEDKYYIEWVERSILKSQKFSTEQSLRRKNTNRTKTETLPKKNRMKTEKRPIIKIDIETNNSIKEVEKLESPFSDLFTEIWEKWKKYKLEQHKFIYKSLISEQSAINSLYKLSNQKEVTAILIVETAIANGWKGFFKLDSNGTDNIGRNERSAITEFINS